MATAQKNLSDYLSIPASGVGDASQIPILAGGQLRLLTFEGLISRISVDSGNQTILDGSITTTKLANSAVTTIKIADGAVTSIKLGEEAVQNANIAPSAVDFSKLLTSFVDVKTITDKFDEQFSLAYVIQDTGIWLVEDPSTQGEPIAHLLNNYTASTKLQTSAFAPGSVTAPILATDSVTNAKIQNSSITTAKLANSAVTANKIADNAVTSIKIAPLAVDFSKLLTSFEDVETIIDAFDGQFSLAYLIGDAGMWLVEDPSVQGEPIAHLLNNYTISRKLTTSAFAPNSVTESILATDSVVTAKIQKDAVVTDKLSDYAVETNKIADGAIATDKIADGAVTKEKVNNVAFGYVGVYDVGDGVKEYGAVVRGASNVANFITLASSYTTATASGIQIPFTDADKFLFTATPNLNIAGEFTSANDIKGVAIETTSTHVRCIFLTSTGANASVTTASSENYAFSLIGVQITN